MVRAVLIRSVYRFRRFGPFVRPFEVYIYKRTKSEDEDNLAMQEFKGGENKSRGHPGRATVFANLKSPKNAECGAADSERWESEQYQ
jgi:hypothetical protein